MGVVVPNSETLAPPAAKVVGTYGVEARYSKTYIEYPDFQIRFVSRREGNPRMEPFSAVYNFEVSERGAGKLLFPLKWALGGLVIPASFYVGNQAFVVELVYTTKNGRNTIELSEGSFIIWDLETARTGNSWVFSHWRAITKKPPNKSPEPTPTAVTPRAGEGKAK